MYFDMKEITPPVSGDHRFFKTQKVYLDINVMFILIMQFIEGLA